jgi:hypothetical protein
VPVTFTGVADPRSSCLSRAQTRIQVRNSGPNCAIGLAVAKAPIAYFGTLEDCRYPAHGLEDLFAGLDRSAFLLGGNDGEHLLGSGQQ